MCLEKEGALEVVLSGRGQMTYLGKESFAWGTRVRETIQTNYKMKFIHDRLFQHFKNTFNLLLQVYCITRKMHISKNVYKTFLEELALRLQRNLWKIKIIIACDVSNNVALSQVVFCYILRTVPKDFGIFWHFFQSISTSHFAPFKFMHAFLHQMNDPDFIAQKRKFSIKDFFSKCDEIRRKLMPAVVAKWLATPT